MFNGAHFCFGHRSLFRRAAGEINERVQLRRPISRVPPFAIERFADERNIDSLAPSDRPHEIGNEHPAMISLTADRKQAPWPSPLQHGDLLSDGDDKGEDNFGHEHTS